MFLPTTDLAVAAGYESSCNVLEVTVTVLVYTALMGVRPYRDLTIGRLDCGCEVDDCLLASCIAGCQSTWSENAHERTVLNSRSLPAILISTSTVNGAEVFGWVVGSCSTRHPRPVSASYDKFANALRE